MQNRPNILLINCDDLGYGDLGCFGSTRNKTPHIDALAANGMRLTDFYQACPVCSASRAAMLTGSYPPRIGFHDYQVLFPGQAEGLHPDENTIADYMKQAGYATKIVGKWHCGDQPEFLPTAHGFDEYFGIPFSNDMGRQSNNPDRPPLPLLRNDQVLQEQPDQRGLTERYAQECVDFIDRNNDQPFFLYLAHMYVHVPLFVPKPFLEASENGAYGGAVACIDWCTGVIVERLKKHGLLDNTLIIFTSDNGSRARDEGGSNAPCRGKKGTTWEGGQRLPCIMHWPAKIKPGQTVSSVTRSTDFLPTLCTLAGVEPDQNRPLDGYDRSELLLGGDDVHADEDFMYYKGPSLCAVRSGDWKLHVARTPLHGWDKPGEQIKELYNLKEDISESNNVYDQHPEIVARLTEKVEAMRKKLGDLTTGIPGSENRPMGRVNSPKALTEYNENHPYIIAMYDNADMPTMCG